MTWHVEEQITKLGCKAGKTLLFESFDYHKFFLDTPHVFASATLRAFGRTNGVRAMTTSTVGRAYMTQKEAHADGVRANRLSFGIALSISRAASPCGCL